MAQSEIQLKRCNRCKLEKKIDEHFYLRKNQRGERVPRSWCKFCETQLARSWQIKNPEKYIENKKRWNQSPQGKISAKNTREKYKDQIALNQKVWRELNREYDLQRKRKYAIEIGNAKRRMRTKDQFIEAVNRDIVYEMHGGMCGICKQFIDLRIEEGFHADHIKPLSKDGMHGYINSQPAHIKCNLRKHNKE